MGAALAPVLLAGLAAGCGNSTFFAGTPVTTMASSTGGFSTYRVYIDYITLTRNDGFVAYLLATPEQVDLASLTDHTELLTAGPVPTGTYTQATIAFDYGATAGPPWSPLLAVNYNGTSAIVNVGGTNAQSVPYLANMSGSNIAGQVLPITVNFDPKNPLNITDAQSTGLAFKVDLEASSIVDTTNLANKSDTSPVVYVNPVVTVSSTLDTSMPVRWRGVMVVVNPQQNNLIMNTHPFNDQLYTLGAVTVQTTAQTYFNVNGTTYTGSGGLNALNALPNTSQGQNVIAAYGTIGSLTNVGVTPTFNATTVLGGTSLESTVQEHITGVVGAVGSCGSGCSSLTIRGATLIPPDYYIFNFTDYPPCAACNGYPQFFDQATVLIDSTTIVSKDGVAESGLGPQSVSVGQNIDVAGQANIDSNNNLSLDARLSAGTAAYSGAAVPTGQVRLLETPLWGTLNSGSATSASIDLLQLGPFIASTFDFTGTGSTAATAATYMVNTSAANTDLTQTAASSLLYMTGYPNTFGSAPPDFNASTVTQPAQQELILEWWASSTAGATPTTAEPAPFTNITAGASGPGTAVLVPNPNSSHLSRGIIRTGPMTTCLILPAANKATACTPTIANAAPVAIPTISTANATTPLQLVVGNLTNDVFVYSDMPSLQTEIATLSGQTNYFAKLVALGTYDAASNTFNATRINLAVQ